ncbi:MAG: hypothetical protein JXA08_10260 [Methanomicrobiaceae archaeon]|nr:hypothetical protein [Methanomicrobiaceae archaeon]
MRSERRPAGASEQARPIAKTGAGVIPPPRAAGPPPARKSEMFSHHACTLGPRTVLRSSSQLLQIELYCSDFLIAIVVLRMF